MHKNNEPLGFAWGYRDFLYAIVAVFMAVAVLSLTVTSKKAKQEGERLPSLTIMMMWPYGVLTDVDLWVKSPSDTPVGYTRPSGQMCDLLHDDRSLKWDPNSRDMELTNCRGIDTSGAYIVNVVNYENYGASYPIPVTIYVKYIGTDGHETFDVISRTILLTSDHQETTVFQFQLDKDGKIVPGSVNDVQVKLYNDAMVQQGPN